MKESIKPTCKALFLSLFLTLIISSAVNAQNHYLGVKAGYLSSNISSSEDIMTETMPRNGLVAGLSYEYNFLKYFTAGAEVLYEQRGWTQEIIYTNEIGLEIGKGTIESNYDYISIPIKAGVTFGNKLSIYANLGIANSFSTSAEMNIPYYDGSSTNEDMKKHVNDFDVAGLFDLGGSLSFLGRFKVFLNLNYQQSFTSFNVEYFSNMELKHYSFSATTGIKYALKK